MEYVAPLNGNLADPNRPYINANPGTNTKGSIPPAAAFEHPMREILNVITTAGITPDDGDLTQLYDAILAIVIANGAVSASDTVKGIIEIATNAEAQAGSATDKALVPSNFVKSLGTNGYLRLPGGLIVQWGTASLNWLNGTVGVTFPLAFPTGIYNAGATFLAAAVSPTGNSNAFISSTGFSASGMTIAADAETSVSSQTVDALWFALGH